MSNVSIVVIGQKHWIIAIIKFDRERITHGQKLDALIFHINMTFAVKILKMFTIYWKMDFNENHVFIASFRYNLKACLNEYLLLRDIYSFTFFLLQKRAHKWSWALIWVIFYFYIIHCPCLSGSLTNTKIVTCIWATISKVEVFINKMNLDSWKMNTYLINWNN